MLGNVFVHPNESSRVDHFGRKQANSPKLSNDFAKCRVREPGHRSLQNRRVNHEIADS